MNSLEMTYTLTKKLMNLKEDLVEWARLSRENKLTEVHEREMMSNAYKIDELLREIGTEWIEDYEANIKIKASLGK